MPRFILKLGFTCFRPFRALFFVSIISSFYHLQDPIFAHSSKKPPWLDALMIRPTLDQSMFILSWYVFCRIWSVRLIFSWYMVILPKYPFLGSNFSCLFFLDRNFPGSDLLSSLFYETLFCMTRFFMLIFLIYALCGIRFFLFTLSWCILLQNRLSYRFIFLCIRL